MTPRKAGFAACIVGAGTFFAYFANRRELGTYDTEPTTLTAFAIARGDGIYIDRFAAVFREADGRVPASATLVDGHCITRYPIAAAIVATPLFWVQATLLDWKYPGWDTTPDLARRNAKTMGKNAAAVMTAMCSVAIFLLLSRLGFAWSGAFASLVAGLGSSLWVVASQALWQHGPAALFLALAILPLAGKPTPPAAFLGSGLAAAMMVAVRPVDFVFAIALFGYAAAMGRKAIIAFALPPLVIGTAVVAFNLAMFDSVLGGQTALEAMHPKLHHVAGPWGNPLAGFLGTLFSPSRGLFAYCPWVAVAMACLPATRGFVQPRALFIWLLGGLACKLVLLSCYAVWWGGHCFGPRYWIDAMPIIAIALAAALRWSWDAARSLAWLLAMSAAWSIGLQAIGAAYYPSSWNSRPIDVDRNHHRLWHVRDNEIVRCLLEQGQR